MEQTVGFELVARLPFTVFKGEQHFVSSCPVLDVHSQGETRDEAKTNLLEAITLFFESCLAHDTLDAALKECGYQVLAETKAHEAPQCRDRRPKFLEVPIPFMTTPGSDNYSPATACHA